MKRSVIKKGNRNAKTSTNIPASTRRAINKKKVSSHQDNIEEKLARMCITPSESHVSKVVNDHAPSAKRTPLQTIEENLSRMCITPSERNASQAVIDKPSSTNKPKAPHKKKSSKKSSTQGVVNRKSKTTFKQYEHGFAPVVPPVLYRYLQNAAGCIKHLETNKDDIHAQYRLNNLELCIGKLAFMLEHVLPKNWEYNRATAHIWEKIPYFY